MPRSPPQRAREDLAQVHGGVTAFGCTVGQGLSGLSTLSLGSFIAVAGIIGGAVVGLHYQAWRLERQS